MAELGADLKRQLRFLRFRGALEREYQEHLSAEQLPRLRIVTVLFVLLLAVPSIIERIVGAPVSGREKVGSEVAGIMALLLTGVGPVVLCAISFFRPWARAVLPATVCWFLMTQFWFGIANRGSSPAVVDVLFVIEIHIVLAILVVAALRAPMWLSLFYVSASWGWSAYTFLSNHWQPKDLAGVSNALLMLLFMMLFLVAGAYFNDFGDRRGFLYRKLLHDEQERLQGVLGNVLPAPIAERLKKSDEVIAEYFPSASVLFADIVDFTPFSRDREPGEVVGFLNEVFSRFDALVQKAGLEKIKTVGDAYMVAAGLPDPRPDHLPAIADLALEMRGAAAAVGVDLRIGFHSGPVVAGVIGTKKYLYDLWGDTVNTASRMESHGLPGEIQCSRAVAEQLGKEYVVEDRGELEVKGLGVVETVFLKRKNVASVLGSREGAHRAPSLGSLS